VGTESGKNRSHPPLALRRDAGERQDANGDPANDRAGHGTCFSGAWAARQVSVLPYFRACRTSKKTTREARKLPVTVIFSGIGHESMQRTSSI
jgi:hypothetical protein